MELFNDKNAVQLFIAFFVPGFIIIKIWEYFVPSEVSDWASRLPEVVAYSSLYYAFTIWPYFILPQRYSNAYAYVDVFLLPIVAAIFIALVRGAPLKSNRGPQNMPWDQFFQRVSCDPALKGGLLVTVQLKDGQQPIVGYFGAKSYASMFPRSPQLYLQRLYKSAADGSIVPVEPTTSALIDCSEVQYLSFRVVEH
jgi:hypothetical protein